MDLRTLAGGHSEALVINPLNPQLGPSKEINPMAWTMKNQGTGDINKPLWGQDIWKDICVHLQEPQAVLTVFHVSAQKTLTPPGHQELDA